MEQSPSPAWSSMHQQDEVCIMVKEELAYESDPLSLELHDEEMAETTKRKERKPSHACSVKDCRTLYGTSGVIFHRFPKDPYFSQLWVEFSQNENLKGHDPMTLNQYSRMCSKHFSIDKYKPNLKNRSINYDAIPTIFDGRTVIDMPKLPMVIPEEPVVISEPSALIPESSAVIPTSSKVVLEPFTFMPALYGVMPSSIVIPEPSAVIPASSTVIPKSSIVVPEPHVVRTESSTAIPELPIVIPEVPEPRAVIPELSVDAPEVRKYKPVKNRCIVKGCDSWKDGCHSFFRFPLDIERCKKWVEAMGSVAPKSKNFGMFHYHYRVCSRHFEGSQYNNALKKRLLWSAVPTIFNDTDANGESSDIVHPTVDVQDKQTENVSFHQAVDVQNKQTENASFHQTVDVQDKQTESVSLTENLTFLIPSVVYQKRLKKAKATKTIPSVSTIPSPSIPSLAETNASPRRTSTKRKLDIDVDAICRLCLRSDRPMRSIYKHEEATMNTLYEVLQVTANRDDGLPQQICHACFFSLDAAYVFKKKCYENLSYLAKAIRPEDPFEMLSNEKNNAQT